MSNYYYFYVITSDFVGKITTMSKMHAQSRLFFSLFPLVGGLMGSIGRGCVHAQRLLQSSHRSAVQWTPPILMNTRLTWTSYPLTIWAAGITTFRSVKFCHLRTFPKCLYTPHIHTHVHTPVHTPLPVILSSPPPFFFHSFCALPSPTLLAFLRN